VRRQHRERLFWSGTPKGSINHVTLDMVDRETSVQLNAERNLEFDLNAARRR